jgi:hypothetical protein
VSQLNFPGITSAYALNPLSYIIEPADAFGVKITSSPSYTAVALAENVDITLGSTTLDIMSAGSFLRYSMRTGGQNFPFHIDVSPLDINFIKIGANIPNLTTPSGTSAASYQFLMKYRQSFGTAALVDTYLFLLGCRPANTTINVTPQGKVTVGQDWVAREMTVSSTSGLTGSPVIPLLSSITGPVIIDADAGSLPLTIDGQTYATNGFTLGIDTGLITQAYNGSGKIDISAPGLHTPTGNFSVPVGSHGISLETIALSNQTGVDIDYNFKSGVMVAHIEDAILESGSRAFPGQPNSILENPFSFKGVRCTLATS